VSIPGISGISGARGKRKGMKERKIKPELAAYV
jgi:hypothetical protein